MTTKLFDSIIMLRFGKTKVRVLCKTRVLQPKKKTRKLWDVDTDNIVVLKSIETKNNSKYLTGSLDEVIRPLLLTFPKMSGFFKIYKETNDKLMSLHINDEKLLEKSKKFGLILKT